MSTSSRGLADLQRSFAADGPIVVNPTTPYDPVPTHAAVNSKANAVNFLPPTPPSPSQFVDLPLTQMSLEARPPSPSLSDPETKLRRYSRDLKEYHEALVSMLNVDTKASAVAQG